jgi:hypothetical protein
VCCDPLDPNVNIAHGDPTPPYLVIFANGNYRIDSLPAGDYYIWAVAYVNNNNKLFDSIRIVSVKARHETSNIDLRLVPGGSISGQIIDENGNPVSSAGTNRSFYMHSIFRVSWEYTVHIAPDGTYSLENLLPGEYQIRSDIVTIESGKETHYDYYIGK